jgi:hypothetical protein
LKTGRFADPQTTLEITKKFSGLGHRDGFGRADIDARAAIAAGVGVNDGQTVLHLDCIQRARFDTGFASGAFCFINYCCHEKTPIMRKKAVND